MKEDDDMDLENARKNTKEYLKEFYKSIPKKNSIFNREASIDNSKIDNIKDKIETFYERGILVSPTLINKESITTYIDILKAVKQFPNNLKPDIIIENNILSKIQKQNNTRRILIPSVMEENSNLMQEYNKMVAHYLAIGGDNPIQRFSKIGISMKQYGISTDIGASIMKYGNDITTKLEELAINKIKSPKEWECFKEQVLHTFFTAEKIGNRNVNLNEHIQWEERLIKLGILERRFDKETKQEISFKENLINMTNDKDSRDNSPNEPKVQTQMALQKNAEQIYIKTGIIPIGYKKNENGKIVRIEPKFETNNRKNRLSASINNLSTTKERKGKEELSI